MFDFESNFVFYDDIDINVHIIRLAGLICSQIFFIVGIWPHWQRKKKNCVTWTFGMYVCSEFLELIWISPVQCKQKSEFSDDLRLCFWEPSFFRCQLKGEITLWVDDLNIVNNVDKKKNVSFNLFW